MAGVSVSTIKRRKLSFGLLTQKQRTNISDEDLDIKVNNIVSKQPQIGIVMMQAALRSEDVWVTRKRIRQSLIRNDPITITLRRKVFVTRRKYNVASSNSLWHLDSNLKLVK